MLTVRRHSARVRLKTGVKRDGSLTAREAEIYLDTGGYADNGPAVAVRAATRVLGPYRIPHIRSDAYAVYTNSGSAGSFRAIGAPQTLFACESQMDIIASALGRDPAELRLQNMLKKGEQQQPKLRGIDADLAGGLKKLLAATQWRRRSRKPGAPIGLACAVTNAGATPVSVAMLRLQSDGMIKIFAGSTEMGQGIRTALAQITAEELAVPLDSIVVLRADTSVTPYDKLYRLQPFDDLDGNRGAEGSTRFEKQLLAIGAAAFRTKPGQVRLEGGALVFGEAKMTYREALQQRFGGSAGELIGRGDVGPEITGGALPVIWEVGMGSVEIELDEETGRVRIKRYVSLADVGKAINPAHCIGQEEGAAMMGIGHTLFEEMVYADGQLVNSTLLGYRVPRFSDLPEEFHTILLEIATARGLSERGEWAKEVSWGYRRR